MAVWTKSLKCTIRVYLLACHADVLADMCIRRKSQLIKGKKPPKLPLLFLCVLSHSLRLIFYSARSSYVQKQTLKIFWKMFTNESMCVYSTPSSQATLTAEYWDIDSPPAFLFRFPVRQPWKKLFSKLQHAPHHCGSKFTCINLRCYFICFLIIFFIFRICYYTYWFYHKF